MSHESDGQQGEWYEVLGKDGTKLKSFFSELFGWSFKDAPGMNYGMTDPETTGIGGGIGSAPGGASWTTFYVGVDDVTRALEKAKELGAKELMPVTKLPDATISSRAAFRSKARPESDTGCRRASSSGQ
jgi:predicted enzyme related to lactoylglutathione lyase